MSKFTAAAVASLIVAALAYTGPTLDRNDDQPVTRHYAITGKVVFVLEEKVNGETIWAELTARHAAAE